jgi:hypothetical protein
VGPNSNPDGDQSDGFASGSGSGSGTGSAGGSSRPHKVVRLPLNRSVSSILSLGSALGMALWTGGVLILVILGLGLLGVLSVPLTYIVGRKRGKW